MYIDGLFIDDGKLFILNYLHVLFFFQFNEHYSWNWSNKGSKKDVDYKQVCDMKTNRAYYLNIFYILSYLNFVFVSLNIFYDLIFKVTMNSLRIHGAMRRTLESLNLKRSVLLLTGSTEGLWELHVMYVFGIFCIRVFYGSRVSRTRICNVIIIHDIFLFSEIPHTAGWNGNLFKERLYAVYR